MEDKEIIELLIQELIEAGEWFTTKKDPTFEEAPSYYELDQYGDPTENTKKKIVNEIKNYIGDGAVDIQDAIELWINEATMQYKVSFIDNLVTQFEPKPVVDQIEAYPVELKEAFNKEEAEDSKNLKTESAKTKMEEENTKSLNLISSMFTSEDFDADSPQGQIVIKTSQLFNELSDKGYNVQVNFDNGESQSDILLGDIGGKVTITINGTNEPIKAFTQGSFELTDDIINTLNEIKDLVDNI